MCEGIIPNIIKLQNEFYDSLKDNQIQFLEGWHVQLNDNEISLRHDGNIDYTNFKKMNYATVCNAMEAFATYFTSKVADEFVAFNTLGTTYIHATEYLMPIILEVNKDGHYKNIVKLYLLWKKRMISNDLQMQQKKIKMKMEKYHSEIVTPIGVE